MTENLHNTAVSNMINKLKWHIIIVFLYFTDAVKWKKGNTIRHFSIVVSLYVQKSEVFTEVGAVSGAADLSADGDELLSFSLLCWLWCLSLPNILPKMSLIASCVSYKTPLNVTYLQRAINCSFLITEVHDRQCTVAWTCQLNSSYGSSTTGRPTVQCP